MHSKHKIAFAYYGGKHSHLDWLLPLLNAPGDERHYVEPFCGSMAVALNRGVTSGKQRRVTVNDKDGAVINFFRVLRERPDELIHLIQLTPRARSEWLRGFEHRDDIEFIERDPLEAARTFFTFITQSFSQISGKAGWGTSPASTAVDNLVAARLWGVAQELQRFRFENRDAMHVIKANSKAETFLYLDPPYTLNERVGKAYHHDDFDDMHSAMLSLCIDNPAWIAISGYHNELYDSKLAGWHVHERETFAYTGTWAQENKDAKKRIEVLWTNYKPRAPGASLW